MDLKKFEKLQAQQNMSLILNKMENSSSK